MARPGSTPDSAPSRLRSMPAAGGAAFRFCSAALARPLQKSPRVWTALGRPSSAPAQLIEASGSSTTALYSSGIMRALRPGWFFM